MVTAKADGTEAQAKEEAQTKLEKERLDKFAECVKEKFSSI